MKKVIINSHFYDLPCMLIENAKLNYKKCKVKQHNANIESFRGNGNEYQNMVYFAEEVK